MSNLMRQVVETQEALRTALDEHSKANAKLLHAKEILKESCGTSSVKKANSILAEKRENLEELEDRMREVLDRANGILQEYRGDVSRAQDDAGV